MSEYLGVTAVEKKGSRVTAIAQQQPRIPAGNVLVAIMNNGLYKVAPNVSGPTEYNHFCEAYGAGAWLKMELYLLPEELVKECPDEGQVRVI